MKALLYLHCWRQHAVAGNHRWGRVLLHSGLTFRLPLGIWLATAREQDARLDGSLGLVQQALIYSGVHPQFRWSTPWALLSLASVLLKLKRAWLRKNGSAWQALFPGKPVHHASYSHSATPAINLQGCPGFIRTQLANRNFVGNYSAKPGVIIYTCPSSCTFIAPCTAHTTACQGARRILTLHWSSAFLLWSGSLVKILLVTWHFYPLAHSCLYSSILFCISSIGQIAFNVS